MRVISGKYKGKNLKGFDIDGTRPTMDRVKESLFGMIQGYIKNSICLDLFAGSGALGIEALSNGSKYCYFVDKGKEVLKVLEENLKNIENAQILKQDYMNALDYFKEKNIKFNIIFLDPPYKEALITPSLSKIVEYDLLLDDGIIVCEYENEIIGTNLSCWREKKYGSKKIAIYKR